MTTFMLMMVLLAGSQDPQVAESRTNEVQAAREEKAQDLKPPQRNLIERVIYGIKERRIIERFEQGVHGFHPLVGGLAPGSGLALGTAVEEGPVRVSAQGSLRGFQKYEVQLKAPKVFNDRFFADFRATHRNYPQLHFFGMGEKSRAGDRTSYRLEDTNYTGRFGFSPARHVQAGVLAGRLLPSVGKGTDPLVPSIEKVFDTAGLPAFGNEPSYLETGAFLEIDYRDKPSHPRSGGRYATSWTSFRDGKLDRYGFGQYDLEATQYFPFFNARRVIALRGKTVLTHTAPGQEIPFFMQPALGGADDLRGFRDERFRDRNMLVLNAEYRWEAFAGLDLALFADAGQVAARPSDIRFSNLRTAYGLGFRFNTSKNVVLRTDVGFSKEGPRVFVKFSHVF
jgi:outer membrane protein assembly factor BamA